MALPSRSSETSLSPDSSPAAPVVSRKRRRASSDDCQSYTGAGHDEETGKEKTRRVNPYKLAERLGPDIVAELEAFIYPGAKMPSYADRKDIQDRYDVDRRHIYDYLHSRGLRVAKEERHINLVRNKFNSGTRPLIKKPKSLPPALNSSRNQKPKTKEENVLFPQPAVKIEYTEPSTPTLTPTLSTSSSTTLYEDQSFELDYPDVDRSLTSPASIKRHFSLEPKVPSQITVKQESSAEETLVDTAFAQEIMDSWVNLDAISDMPPTSEPFIGDAAQTYDLIDFAAGSLYGVQASAGSYMTHMSDQSQNYYTRLYASSQPNMIVPSMTGKVSSGPQVAPRQPNDTNFTRLGNKENQVAALPSSAGHELQVGHRFSNPRPRGFSNSRCPAPTNHATPFIGQIQAPPNLSAGPPFSGPSYQQPARIHSQWAPNLHKPQHYNVSAYHGMQAPQQQQPMPLNFDYSKPLFDPFNSLPPRMRTASAGGGI